MTKLFSTCQWKHFSSILSSWYIWHKAPHSTQNHVVIFLHTMKQHDLYFLYLLLLLPLTVTGNLHKGCGSLFLSNIIFTGSQVIHSWNFHTFFFLLAYEFILVSTIEVVIVMLSKLIYSHDSNFSAKQKSCLDRIPTKCNRVYLPPIYTKSNDDEMQASKYLSHWHQPLLLISKNKHCLLATSFPNPVRITLLGYVYLHSLPLQRIVK